MPRNSSSPALVALLVLATGCLETTSDSGELSDGLSPPGATTCGTSACTTDEAQEPHHPPPAPGVEPALDANINSNNSAPVCEMTEESCKFEAGLTHLCKQRFSLGVNYAWHEFAADFGGLSAWGKPSVSTDSGTFAAELAEMSLHGAQTVRWWMFPDFRGDGVLFDEAGDPTGLSQQAIADIQMALDLAEAHDIYLVLTLFSFDNFRPSYIEGGVLIRGMAPMVRNVSRRKALIQNVVQPAAQAAAASENSHRLLAWDIINEPEWAISETPSAPTGSQFTPNGDLELVSLSEMKALIGEAGAALKQITPQSKLSVGWAAAKWAWAFSEETSVDFHQPHIYAWVNEWWPYTSTPGELGYTGKPTVMGEFYLASMPFSTGPDHATILSTWYGNGYAGAWSWQYNENSADLGLTETFAETKGCTVRY